MSLPGWIDLAACADPDVDPAAFDHTHPDLAADALEVCAGCAVVAECRAYADGLEHAEGVWGGRVLRRRGPGTRRPPARTIEATCARCGDGFPRRPHLGAVLLPVVRAGRLRRAGADRTRRGRRIAQERRNATRVVPPREAASGAHARRQPHRRANRRLSPPADPPRERLTSRAPRRQLFRDFDALSGRESAAGPSEG